MRVCVFMFVILIVALGLLKSAVADWLRAMQANPFRRVLQPEAVRGFDERKTFGGHSLMSRLLSTICALVLCCLTFSASLAQTLTSDSSLTTTARDRRSVNIT